MFKNRFHSIVAGLPVAHCSLTSLPAASFSREIAGGVTREYASLENFNLHCHANPELSFHENEVRLQFTVRSFTDEVRNNTLAPIRRIVRGQALAAGIPNERLPEVTVGEREFTPSTCNSPELPRRLESAFKTQFGGQNAIERKPATGGEDFSEYSRTSDKIPICLFWLGTIEPERVAESPQTGKPLPALHSSLFRPVPVPSIKTGVTAMSTAVLELAGKK